MDESLIEVHKMCFACVIREPFSILSSHLDSQCPPVPDVPHASANSTSRSHGSVVGFQCDTGYAFSSNGDNITTVQCYQTQWTQAPSPCESKKRGGMFLLNVHV